MRDIHAFLFVLSYFLLDVYIGRINYSKCDRKATPYIVLHHLILSILLFGWLFTNKYILLGVLILILSILIHWITNNSVCRLTVIHNRLCGLPDNAPFKDSISMSGLKKYDWFRLYVYYGYVIFVICMIVYKLVIQN
jgi:hypothetical protein